jgi:hypothetical protein
MIFEMSGKYCWREWCDYERYNCKVETVVCDKWKWTISVTLIWYFWNFIVTASLHTLSFFSCFFAHAFLFVTKNISLDQKRIFFKVGY